MVAFIDYRTTDTEKNSLLNLGIDFLEVPKFPILYDAIDGHVDIQINIIDKKEKKIILHKDIDEIFIQNISSRGINYIKSESSITEKYPGNIILNAAILENDVIHNFKYTDKNLLSSINDKNLINIKQGYSKCSILPILLLPPGDILLPGLNYGFIGGVGGKIDDDTIAFFGDLNYYQYGDEIKNFLSKYDVRPVYLRKGKLIDRGSLMLL